MWIYSYFQKCPEGLNWSYLKGSLVILQFWNKIRIIFCRLFLCFVWIIFFLKKHRILINLFFEKVFSRIHKNELTNKLCTILEWDKRQQYADFIKFSILWFILMQSYRTFFNFFWIRLYYFLTRWILLNSSSTKCPRWRVIVVSILHNWSPMGDHCKEIFAQVSNGWTYSCDKKGTYP